MHKKYENWEEKYGKRREENGVVYFTPPDRIAEIKRQIQDQFFKGQQAMWRRQIEKEQGGV